MASAKDLNFSTKSLQSDQDKNELSKKSKSTTVVSETKDKILLFDAPLRNDSIASTSSTTSVFKTNKIFGMNKH